MAAVPKAQQRGQDIFQLAHACKDVDAISFLRHVSHTRL
jgi:hypothetical protein